jgi:hypothetical protein
MSLKIKINALRRQLMRNLTKNIGALYDKKCDITTVTLKKNIDL